MREVGRKGAYAGAVGGGQGRAEGLADGEVFGAEVDGGRVI